MTRRLFDLGPIMLIALLLSAVIATPLRQAIGSTSWGLVKLSRNAVASRSGRSLVPTSGHSPELGGVALFDHQEERDADVEDEEILIPALTSLPCENPTSPRPKAIRESLDSASAQSSRPLRC